jgi:Ca2+-binding RTX toxin-like protein
MARRINGTPGNDVLIGRDREGLGILRDGIDIIRGLGGNDILEGRGADDQLYGGAGDDRLDGGRGRDRMEGGSGFDTYVVENAGDLVIEQVNEGLDTVESSINYTLPEHVENLTLIGSANLNGTGNELGNTIIGNSGRNHLSGQDGRDRLFGREGDDSILGGAGDDNLFGEDGNDFLQGEAGSDFLDGGNGGDTLNGGTSNDFLTGGTGDDLLIGGEDNDSLRGGAGNDVLIGGAGSDDFIFESFRPFRRADLGVDTIRDFARGDKMVLSTATFTTLSSLSSVSGVVGFSDVTEFAVVGTDAAAARSRAEIVYNSTNGKLFYNPNGRAIGFDTALEGGHFVTLSGAPGLRANDFVLTEPAPLI